MIMDARKNHNSLLSTNDLQNLANDIKDWGIALGFQQVGITDTDLSEAETHLLNWLESGFQGKMQWMARHGIKRSRPAELLPGTLRVISVRMDYLPPATHPQQILRSRSKAYISRYALGRDYHRVIRNRLQKLANRIEQAIGLFGYRAFVDSAPVLEKALAEKAGLGWIGKHSNLLNRQAGSWFFLGELYVDVPLPVDPPADNHCGTCQACIEICPTGAIIAPYKVDARLCISYLTIELRGSIPVELRPLLGNRIYGCDDCQLVCPWNRFARHTQEQDFYPRGGLDAKTLVELFLWDEATFLHNTAGTAIRRIGHECWLRNIAVALGNATPSKAVIEALNTRKDHPSALVREHTQWALKTQQQSQTASF